MAPASFPKSHNLPGGLGTALKPAHEPIVVARKPLVGTVAQNVERFGTGALNIDATRIGTDSTERKRTDDDFGLVNDDGWEPTPGLNGSLAGRWPANVALSHLPECGKVFSDCPVCDVNEYAGPRTCPEHPNGPSFSVEGQACAPGCPVAELDRQSGERPSSGGAAFQPSAVYGASLEISQQDGREIGYGDTGGASRFFYCAKSSRSERNAGLEGFEASTGGSLQVSQSGDTRVGRVRSDGAVQRQSTPAPSANSHPTVKPVDLMRWLCRLVTPPDGTVLDPFAGSGTTGIACVLEDFDFIGIERDESYCEIARARIDYWAKQPKQLDLLDAA